MKRKILVVLVSMILCIATAASAGLASLDAALSPLLEGQDAVQMSVGLTVKSLMPFDDARLVLFNRVLQHAKLNLILDGGSGDTDTSFVLTLGGDTLFEMKEQRSGGAYLLQTSLLPNRMLFSTQASPMDTLLLSSQPEAGEVAESLDANTSDVEEAFDMLAAVPELESCYRDLVDQTVPLTEKNNVSYTIENIGKGRVSYVVKLTADQCAAMVSQLRALISCGMDEEYRRELAQVTFARGFTVALYQNADGQDICVYLKGTILYPDGDRRTLKWQWGFTPDGQTQTFLHQVSREQGRRDTRNITAVLKRPETKSGYTLECETTANLKRGGKSETSTLTMDLSGATGDAASCTGSVTRVTGGTNNEDKLDETTTRIEVDLALAKSETGAVLTGTATYRKTVGKVVYTEFELNFAQPAQAAQSGAAAVDTAQSASPSVEISIVPADPVLAQQEAQTPTVVAEEMENDSPEFLVGTAPVGLYDYEIPTEMLTISMDTTQRKVHQSLMNEAAQRLAGNLILAILNLPAEDREILSDGMTEMDYLIFLAMLD